MRLVPVNEIVIADNRQRRSFSPEALLELQESIEKFGLMHPLVIRNGNHLVAGERRLRAIREIWALDSSFHCHNSLVPAGLVPCVDLGDLDPLEAMEAELDENIKRTDLTWQERAAATKALHDLRVAQASARGEAHSVADTAMETEGRSDGYYQAKTREAIIVASHLDNPDVARAKDSGEALKIIKRAEEARKNAALAATVGATFGAHSHTLLLGDCVEFMLSMEPGLFDVIVTDPPYGMGADGFGDAAGKLIAIDHDYRDDNASFKSLMERAAIGFARVSKPAAHLYVCCDIDQFHWLKQLFASVGSWNVFRTPFINVKRGGGRVPLPEHGPRRSYETILYAYRGDKRCTAIYPDVIHTDGDDNLGHGAQKPVALFGDLLRRSAHPGDRVLDPFAGTGTIFPAAHSLKLAATGIEMNQSYYGIAVKRIEALDADTPLRAA